MIDTRRLRTLRAVADHGTVTAAAATLHLTPSAVSQQLVALEHEVGHRLFTRDGRGVRLTAVGTIMLRHADEVLAQLERAEAEVASYAGGEAGEVTVACFATAISAVLAPAVAALRLKAPALQVRVRDVEGDQGLAMLLDERADLAVVVEYRGWPDAADRRLSRVPLYAEPFDLVLPDDHPLAAGSSTTRPSDEPVTLAGLEGEPVAPADLESAPGTLAEPESEPVALADLAGETWIGPHPGNPIRDVIAFACEQAGFTPEFAHCSDDFRAVVALVGAGAGIALVPRLALRDMTLTGVTVRPAPGPERRVFAAVRRGAAAHPLLRQVLDTLRAIAPA
ncbi:LysR family transcriptional regulator [Nonomuraea roseoviolacea]|uniref:DNA-binding transcriptional LysR family regulator n=1 Tax=Nonomuraea roseoviolacea subsp. carminata TaxID=160689 RepID=A0ABT1K239_9ACTN|nr:LysR family transcriptional regulator [Nonomuraea roseoviolacea]MCP2348058.1 DNA-binding transcriptional LysR family regulator [Nonomuraea roseoviolacea subsp. carminata]